MNWSELLSDAENHITKLFQLHGTKLYPYHDFLHTFEVVHEAARIGSMSEFTEEELTLVKLAGWFHDVGYLINPIDHEQKSAELAKNFLSSYLLPEYFTPFIVGCILATKFPQTPNNKLEACLCDADLHHLAKSDFFKRSLKLKSELNKVFQKRLSTLNYWEITIDFFHAHHYHTDYGKSVLEEGKQYNFHKLVQKVYNTRRYFFNQQNSEDH